MSDLIGRQAAVDAVKEVFMWHDLVTCDRVVNHLLLLPTAEPERKRGQWEKRYSRPGVLADLCWHCSACGAKFSSTYAFLWTYCPTCGAEMEMEYETD